MELSKMEQRYDAVVAVIRDGLTVTEAVEKFGVSVSLGPNSPSTHPGSIRRVSASST